MENENEAAEETIIILFICTLKRVAAECSFLVFVGNEVVFGSSLKHATKMAHTEWRMA